jgi:hypothetical protein
MKQSLDSENSICRERNKKAIEIFTSNDLNVRLLGNDHSPMFILDDRCMLSCFINKGRLYFRPGPNSSEILRSIDLSRDYYLNKHELSELIEASKHLPVFRIRHIDSKMYLVGFNHNEDIDKRYPVFALHKPIVYLN